ncbi:MAG: integrase core domain-containing protein [Verrucomicrobiota bacterium]
MERLIGSIRRECLNHVRVLHVRHLHRMLSDYFDYFHRHRPHRTLDQDCSKPRAVEPPNQGSIIALPLLRNLGARLFRPALWLQANHQLRGDFICRTEAAVD